MSPGASEYTVSKTYVDWLLDLPWNLASEDLLDLKRAEEILERDHFGLEDVKERIIEYLAVRKLKADHKGPILCLAGPPGVGKTSLGRSIAEAVGRKFFRFSLGGMRDEAEIRGHRRTYVGAMPGRIIHGIKECGTNNPLIMLDEIDKLGQDFRGDPASALLEVLDPEQNFEFTDHYLTLPFDLSKTMFITTANMLDTIPRPLLDRMEVIQLAGYTNLEKLQIAKRYLVPRQIEANGLSTKHIRFTDAGLMAIIEFHTREAGVRNLEREIGAVCRKVATDVAKGKKKRQGVGAKNLPDYLGSPSYSEDRLRSRLAVGVVTGLAWTQVGGKILYIEGLSLPGGRGNLKLTGQVGSVMQESAAAAYSYLRNRFGGKDGVRALLRRARCPHPPAGRGDPQGRPQRGHRHGHGPALAAAEAQRRPADGHDRRDHADGRGAAHRRPAREGAGGAPRRHQHGDHPRGQRGRSREHPRRGARGGDLRPGRPRRPGLERHLPGDPRGDPHLSRNE